MNAPPTRQAPFASPGLAAELAQWLRHLASERQLSVKTVEAYGRDVAQFLGFLSSHSGRG